MIDILTGLALVGAAATATACAVAKLIIENTAMQQGFKGKRKDSALGGFSARNARFAG